MFGTMEQMIFFEDVIILLEKLNLSTVKKKKKFFFVIAIEIVDQKRKNRIFGILKSWLISY